MGRKWAFPVLQPPGQYFICAMPYSISDFGGGREKGAEVKSPLCSPDWLGLRTTCPCREKPNISRLAISGLSLEKWIIWWSDRRLETFSQVNVEAGGSWVSTRERVSTEKGRRWHYQWVGQQARKKSAKNFVWEGSPWEDQRTDRDWKVRVSFRQTAV